MTLQITVLEIVFPNMEFSGDFLCFQISSVPFMTVYSLYKGDCVDLTCKSSPPYALRSLGNQRAGTMMMM